MDEPDQRTVDRQEDLYTIKDLQDLLIEAMNKLHVHVIHAGTDFEGDCLRAVNVDPAHVTDYGKKWRELQASR